MTARLQCMPWQLPKPSHLPKCRLACSPFCCCDARLCLCTALSQTLQASQGVVDLCASDPAAAAASRTPHRELFIVYFLQSIIHCPCAPRMQDRARVLAEVQMPVSGGGDAAAALTLAGLALFLGA